MKVILVLCVIFLKYLRYNNVSGALLFLEKGSLSECQGENCLVHYKSLNRRSLDDIEAAIIGTSQKLSNRQLRQTRRSSLIENVEKQIHRDAINKIKSTIKLNKQHQKRLKKLAKKGLITISSLMKISHIEYQKLVENAKIAKNITLSSAEEIMKFVNTSVEKIRSLIEKTGEDIKELADSYWHKLIDNATNFMKKIANASSYDEKKKYTEEAKVFIKQLIYCSGHRLYEVLRNGESQITALANSCGTTIIDMSKRYCDRFKTIGNKEERLQKYIDYVCDRMKQLAEHSSDKFYQLGKSCSEYLQQLAQNSVENAINRLTDILNNMFDAYRENDKQKIADIEKQIQVLYEKMDHSNEEKYNQMIREMNDQANQIMTYNEIVVRDIQTCKNGNPASCRPSN